jgi:hypothetical protein
MAVDIKGDTDRVREEFDNLSTPTQVFIWSLVGLGVIIGLLLGGAVAYGVAVEEVDGRDCIELDDTLYCARTARCRHDRGHRRGHRRDRRRRSADT